MGRSSEPVRTQHRESTTEAVVLAVAREREVEPTALEPLASVVDPDALDALFPREGSEPSRGPESMEFSYSGCDVVVNRDGAIELTRS